MPAIPAPRRLREKDFGTLRLPRDNSMFWDSLGYSVRCCLKIKVSKEASPRASSSESLAEGWGRGGQGWEWWGDDPGQPCQLGSTCVFLGSSVAPSWELTAFGCLCCPQASLSAGLVLHELGIP